jgi:hypothetical protein
VKSIFLIISLSIFILCSYARSSDFEPNLIFYADYENKEINSGNINVGSVSTAADSIMIDCNRARRGHCSLKSSVENSSAYISYGALRSETDATKVSGVIYKNGDHFRYLFSILIDDQWGPSDPDSVDIIWQFKRFASGPDMFIALKNNAIVWRITESDQKIILTPIIKGKWIDFYFDIHWANDEKGIANVRVSVDGADSRFSFFGRNMRISSSDSGTIQWGLYKPGDRSFFNFIRHSINHDEIYIYKFHK